MFLGYLFAFLVVASGAVKGFCGKKISEYTHSLSKASYSNFVRMAICILVGFVLVLLESGLSGLSVSFNVVMISALSGISTAVFVITWVLAVRTGAYMMIAVFLLLGTSLPIFLSYIFYGEKLVANDFIGFSLLIIASVLLYIYNNKIKGRITLGCFILTAISALANGILSFSQKMFTYNASGSSVSVFNFYIYVFGTAILGIFFLISRCFETDRERKKINFPVNVYVAILIMALALFSSSYFTTLAAGRLSSAELFPLMQCASIIVSTFMSAIFFTEKVKPILLVGLVFAFLGAVVMNIL